MPTEQKSAPTAQERAVQQERTTVKAADGSPIAVPEQTEVGAVLADGNYAARQVLKEEAVAQGAYDKDVEESEQNAPKQAAKNRQILQEEQEAFEEETEKLKEENRQAREDEEQAQADEAKKSSKDNK